VKLFSGYAGKTLCQIKTHLVTKQTDGTGTGSVFLAIALVEDILQKLQVGFHDLGLTLFL
jgi:hypothetical protein